MRTIKNLKEYIPGKSIPEIALEYGLKEDLIIKLGSNENPLGSPIKVLEKLKDFCKDDEGKILKILSTYPDSLGQSLVKALKSTFTEIGQAEVIVGNGMDNILECLSRLLIEPGSKTIIHTPTFEYYEMVTRWMHAEPIFVRTSTENNFELDLDEYLSKLSPEVKIAFLCSPNNPTGNTLDWSSIEKIILKAKETGTYVFLDEAYAEYSGSTHIDKVQKYNNLIIGRTFSKVYALAGLRVGWGVIPQTLLKNYRKIQTPFNLNRLSLISAIEALQQQDFIKESIEFNERGKIYLHDNLSKLGFKVFDTKANFLAFLAGKRFQNKAAELCQYLLTQGIILRNASYFRDASEDLVRITVGTSEQNSKIIKTLSDLKT
ncbi:MAG: histidinol-phosphate transaminase [Candidatus Caenarcaniphilales bacterium]|nr:histidinol-phosphate transaminase [Candidatus Caenarcaniphilales bacterium]